MIIRKNASSEAKIFVHHISWQMLLPSGLHLDSSLFFTNFVFKNEAHWQISLVSFNFSWLSQRSKINSDLLFEKGQAIWHKEDNRKLAGWNFTWYDVYHY